MDKSRSRNLTLKLDASLYKAIKVIAAKRGTSISGLVSEKLAEIVNGLSHFLMGPVPDRGLSPGALATA